MSWLELDQIILVLSLFLAGNAIYCLAAWLLPAIAVTVTVTLGGCFVVAWVLSR
jgi:hypothetical protein